MLSSGVYTCTQCFWGHTILLGPSIFSGHLIPLKTSLTVCSSLFVGEDSDESQHVVASAFNLGFLAGPPAASMRDALPAGTFTIERDRGWPYGAGLFACSWCSQRRGLCDQRGPRNPMGRLGVQPAAHRANVTQTRNDAASGASPGYDESAFTRSNLWRVCG